MRSSPSLRLGAAAAAALLAGIARADYMLVTVFELGKCAGAPMQVVGTYLGCLAAPDGSLSYSVLCVNASAFDVSYFSGAACAGAPVHVAPVGWPTGCVPNADGKSSVTQVCKSGSYVAPADAINVYSFASARNSCPLTNLHFNSVATITKSCHPDPNGGGIKSFEYSCNAENVTVRGEAGEKEGRGRRRRAQRECDCWASVRVRMRGARARARVTSARVRACVLTRTRPLPSSLARRDRRSSTARPAARARLWARRRT